MIPIPLPGQAFACPTHDDPTSGHPVEIEPDVEKTYAPCHYDLMDELGKWGR